MVYSTCWGKLHVVIVLSHIYSWNYPKVALTYAFIVCLWYVVSWTPIKIKIWANDIPEWRLNNLIFGANYWKRARAGCPERFFRPSPLCTQIRFSDVVTYTTLVIIACSQQSILSFKHHMEVSLSSLPSPANFAFGILNFGAHYWKSARQGVPKDSSDRHHSAHT